MPLRLSAPQAPTPRQQRASASATWLAYSSSEGSSSARTFSRACEMNEVGGAASAVVLHGRQYLNSAPRPPAAVGQRLRLSCPCSSGAVLFQLVKAARLTGLAASCCAGGSSVEKQQVHGAASGAHKRLADEPAPPQHLAFSSLSALGAAAPFPGRWPAPGRPPPLHHPQSSLPCHALTCYGTYQVVCELMEGFAKLDQDSMDGVLPFSRAPCQVCCLGPSGRYRQQPAVPTKVCSCNSVGVTFNFEEPPLPDLGHWTLRGASFTPLRKEPLGYLSSDPAVL